MTEQRHLWAEERGIRELCCARGWGECHCHPELFQRSDSLPARLKYWRWITAKEWQDVRVPPSKPRCANANNIFFPLCISLGSLKQECYWTLQYFLSLSSSLAITYGFYRKHLSRQHLVLKYRPMNFPTSSLSSVHCVFSPDQIRYRKECHPYPVH